MLRNVQLQPPQIPLISNLTGTWINPHEATNPEYWGQHLRQTVRFSSGVSHLLQQHDGIFLEVGPGRTLSTLTTQHLNGNQKQKHLVLTSLHHPQQQQSDVAWLLQTLGRLWLFGVEIDWSEFNSHQQRHRLPLPTYPFERQRYWIEPEKQQQQHHYHPTPALGKNQTFRSGSTYLSGNHLYYQYKLKSNNKQRQNLVFCCLLMIMAWVTNSKNNSNNKIKM
ncbi:hypothetical protein [Fischerella sp. JS2]|uniref:hypothetical protein n=1 Tax=Fischerella sp. JS2 TaxID=2597771 RepID=UPI0028EB3355|nr:hypothetical protein [Fischerella sp. JS2]